MRNASVWATLLAMMIGTAAIAEADDASRQAPRSFPAASRFWRAADYKDVLALVKNDKSLLPSVSNPATEAYFRRLTSADNLSIYTNQTLPIEIRAKDYSALYQAAIALFSLYVRAEHDSKSRATEVAHFSAFIMQLSAVGVQVLPDYLASVPPGPEHDASASHLKRTWMAYQSIWLGAAQELGETQRYSTDDRSYVLNVLSNTIPEVIGIFQADFKAELRSLLISYRPQYAQSADQAILDRAIAQLSAQ